MANAVISGVGLADARSKSFGPARLDWTQNASGLFVALFMWGHMFFASSILVSEHAMRTVTKMFEGYFVFGRPYRGFVSAVVAGVTAVIVLPAALALRKFPINWRQYTIGDDDGVFGCMSLLGCHDVCPKELPLETRIGFLRRKIGVRSKRSEGRLNVHKFISARCEVAGVRSRLSRRPCRRELRALPMIHRR